MRPLYFVPLLAFVALAVFFMVGLGLNPKVVPSARVGKPLPSFSMPELYDETTILSDDDLRDGRVKLLNVFAEWCVPCRVEHPLLMALAERGTVIYGLNYKDEAPHAKRFLAELGNPYTRIGQDKEGRTGIDFGISGVPETFVVDGEGRILYQHIGPLNREAILENILPLLESGGS